MRRKDWITKITENFQKVKIAVLGDLMLDDYIIGKVERISPEAPVPVVNVEEEKFVLGGAANVVNNLSNLGAEVYCLGVIGTGHNSKRLLSAFDKKVHIDGIIRSEERPTIVKKRVLSGNHQLLRLDWEDSTAISKKLEDELLERFVKISSEIDAIILSDYNKGVLTSRVSKEIIRICREKNIIVTVDPKPINIDNYCGASSITPNRKEAYQCAGVSTSYSIEALGMDLRKKYELETVLITRSEEGMSLYQEDIYTVPTFAKEVYDVTGAGDTVISVFTLSKVAGASWQEAAEIANTAAGVVVGKVGTSTVSIEEIQREYCRIYE
ncbi:MULTISPECIES: D-glycero-beta-D-manno-heptose-7-phosphate kinase [Fusobacterium]|uniref:Protein RfaE, domain I n=1 Tax=Fusobacterium equinum TaxID=134605 RepID=A0A133NHG9_9FUSO|nr:MULTISPECIES: D-glycero-beta-D-manno-heptose-7-phosphate kinase [Fusobacterium]AVQ16494.1 D-glycero-beta-D-manno-heptose-7-phosphate kinase [Fusobacterium gonidiaformans ATCC 25563]EFS29248.1 RfaE, domain I [Fusobacterium gonidiaformans ATCC 25563]KXA15746.1 protein RfaE, domain I [Fusobacterium equinum]